MMLFIKINFILRSLADGSRILRYFEIISDTPGYYEIMTEVTLNWLLIATYNIHDLDNR